MRFTPTKLLVALACAVLLLGVIHPRSGFVYNFPDNFRLYKSHAIFTIAADCAPGQECAFTQNVTGGGPWLNNTYSCWANQDGGHYQYIGITFECYPVSTQAFALQFLNTTGVTIPAGTQMSISFMASGLASPPPTFSPPPTPGWHRRPPGP